VSTPAIEAAKARRADELCQRAETAVGVAWDLLAEVHSTEARRHRGDGYASFAAWARARLNLSTRQSYRYLAKAQAMAELIEGGASEVEAAVAVPLTPPRMAEPAVVNWSKPMKRIDTLQAEISHWNPVDMPPSVRERVAALLADMQRLLSG
jgi:hypothetical protein